MTPATSRSLDSRPRDGSPVRIDGCATAGNDARRLRLRRASRAKRRSRKRSSRSRCPSRKRRNLANGLHLMVLEDHRAPIVNFLLIIEGAGGYYDSDRHAGPGRLRRDVDAGRHRQQDVGADLSELDRLAATVIVGAGISSPFATVSGSALTDSVDTVFATTADVVMHPSFPQVEIDRYKTRTRAALMNQRSQPSFLASERFQRAVFGDHPAARVSATPESLGALTREALVAFHKAHYVPDRAVLAIAGDITLPVAKQKVEAALSGWAKAGVTIAATREPAPLSGGSISLIARPALRSNQPRRRHAEHRAHRSGLRGADRGEPRPRRTQRPALQSSARAERLHVRRRQRVLLRAYRGSWSANTDVRTEVTDPALTDLLDEIRQMRDQPVPAEELVQHQTRYRRGVCAIAREPERDPEQLHR